MNKILIIFTGGTIGSKLVGTTLNVEPGAAYTLIDGFHRQSDIPAEFDTLQPLDILSENMLPSHWQSIFDAVRGAGNGYDGIIITHGTDTMPYTMAAISYLLGDFGCPIVFVASNRRLDDPEGNGQQNFIAAVQFIAENKGSSGVFACFRNARGEMVVYLGTRLMESDPVFHQYRAYLDMDYGRMHSGRFILNAGAGLPAPAMLWARRCEYGIEGISFARGILALRPYPGLDYTWLNLDGDNPPAAVLHGLYHSSTACVTPPNYALTDFAERCGARGIDLYIHDGRNCVGNMYDTSRRLLDAGVRPLSGLSWEAAVAKLHVAYNQTVCPPEAYMGADIFFEHAEV